MSSTPTRNMSIVQLPRSKMFRRVVLLMSAVGLLLVLTGSLHAASNDVVEHIPGYTEASLQIRNLLEASSQMIFAEKPKESPLLCPTCNCSVPGSYATSPFIGRAADLSVNTPSQLRRVWSQPAEVARYLLHHVVLEAQLNPVLYNDEASLAVAKRLLTCPDQVFAYNLTGLELGMPTSYVYTRTGPSGRLASIGARPRYMQRHVEMIHQYNNLTKEKGYPDGTPGNSKQLIWLVLEDQDIIDESIAKVMQESGIPFIYLAHGPTKKFGKAQWNQALKLVEHLRDDFLGDGPIYNLDDDSYVLPELLRKIWKVQKAIGFQVGNLPCPQFNSSWEGPVFESGNMTNWFLGGLPDRVFPIDMNGFAINSTVVGKGREVHGPKYVPFDRSAGESEFLEQIYSKREEIEPLCDDTIKEKCWYVWHNGWMKEEVDARHPPMAPFDMI